MVDLTQFLKTLGKVQHGDIYNLLQNRPEQEEDSVYRSMVVVGVDPVRASVQVVDFLQYQTALSASKPIQAVGKSVSAVKDFFTRTSDKEFAGKADRTVTSIRHSIAKTTVRASWVPYCWIDAFKYISACPPNILEAMRETHPPVGFSTKK